MRHAHSQAGGRSLSLILAILAGSGFACSSGAPPDSTDGGSGFNAATNHVGGALESARSALDATTSGDSQAAKASIDSSVASLTAAVQAGEIDATQGADLIRKLNVAAQRLPGR